jgi:hypothetical protein
MKPSEVEKRNTTDYRATINCVNQGAVEATGDDVRNPGPRTTTGERGTK